MDKITIDQALIASRGHENKNTDFTDRVMKTIAGNQHRQSPFTAFWRLPKFALAAIAVICLALTSGTAYAAYQLWLKPSASVQAVGQNQYGRTEALVDFKNCGETASVSYEIKAGSTLTAEEITQLLQARCEIDAITNWANKNWGPSTQTISTNVAAGALSVAQIDGSKISLRGQFSTDIYTNSATLFIADGVQVGVNPIKTGDTITYIERDTYPPSGNGSPINRETLAIIKLDLPLAAYSTNQQMLVAERKECLGNPGDSCLNSAYIDVYPLGGENATAPATAPGSNFEIQGEIVNINGQNFTLKGASGALYSVTAPQDIIAGFNSNASSETIETGDTLSIHYRQASGENRKIIKAEQIYRVNLLTQLGNNKTDAAKKY